MDAMEYKLMTSAPIAFRCSEIEATFRVLRDNRSQLADTASQIAFSPIPKPALHAGGRDTRFVRVTASLELVNNLVHELLIAEAAAVSPAGKTTQAASKCADLVDRWTQYKAWLEESTEKQGAAPDN